MNGFRKLRNVFKLLVVQTVFTIVLTIDIKQAITLNNTMGVLTIDTKQAITLNNSIGLSP